MHTLIQSHMQNCVFWQDIMTGDYAHVADAGVSLSSANPVSFALEKMRAGGTANESRREKKNIKLISVLHWGFRQCLISS